jgi:ABC-type glycerol-3-phosphate transport system permease component
MNYYGTHRVSQPRVVVQLGRGFLVVTAIGILLLAPILYVVLNLLSTSADVLRIPTPSPLPTVRAFNQEAPK